MAKSGDIKGKTEETGENTKGTGKDLEANMWITRNVARRHTSAVQYSYVAAASWAIWVSPVQLQTVLPPCSTALHPSLQSVAGHVLLAYMRQV